MLTVVVVLVMVFGVAVTGTRTASQAEAKPINPYVPCPDWQILHPGWPCFGNFPEIEEPTLPSLPPPPPGLPTPAVPAPQTTIPTAPPSTTSVSPPAAALTPPAPQPAPNPCQAIIPVPGYVPPALPGHPANAACSYSPPSSRPPTPREAIEPYLHEAKTWGACGINSPDDKTVRSFDRGTIKIGDRVFTEGQSVLQCGNDRYGYRHLQSRQHDRKWGAVDYSYNWRDNADRIIEKTLRKPDVACYSLPNNTYVLGLQLWEYVKRDGRLTGKTQWSNVVIDANNGRIITAFPTLQKPRCQ
ncbi:hypothetical protein [Nocardia macrotermitis]|uniref:hypothetical protein n=1 Tax=Nocardia macrotermitis TaxID=2585198 RepID=UPI001297C54F|nr:hypothetical protein [Nocardia macrotermitis]